MTSPKPHLLTFANYNDPILRKKTKAVTFPLSAEDRQTIADMKFSIQPEQLKKADAAWEGGAAGMAANQWGIDKSIFMYCPSGDTKHVEVAINPSYEYIGDEADQEWEGCFSIPLSTGKIKRSKTIRAKFQNENGEVIEQTLTGWDARVWQHETDHLSGSLYDDPLSGKCLEKKVFDSRHEVDSFYDEVRKNRQQK